MSVSTGRSALLTQPFIAKQGDNLAFGFPNLNKSSMVDFMHRSVLQLGTVLFLKEKSLTFLMWFRV